MLEASIVIFSYMLQQYKHIDCLPLVQSTFRQYSNPFSQNTRAGDTILVKGFEYGYVSLNGIVRTSIEGSKRLVSI